MIAGNFAIKRDMTHESEVAMKAALDNFAAVHSPQSSHAGATSAANYSAVALPSTNGIPNSLLSATVASQTLASSASGMTYRYVIDRMCLMSGAPNLATHCVTGSPPEVAIDAFNPLANSTTGTPNDGVYRISVRLTDPKSTESFFQTTIKSNGT